MKREANGYKFETLGDELRITFPSSTLVYKDKKSVAKLSAWMLDCLAEHELERSGKSSTDGPVGGHNAFSPIGSTKSN